MKTVIRKAFYAEAKPWSDDLRQGFMAFILVFLVSQFLLPFRLNWSLHHPPLVVPQLSGFSFSIAPALRHFASLQRFFGNADRLGFSFYIINCLSDDFFFQRTVR